MHRDSLWKGIIEEIFDDLLRFVFPNADKLFDLNRRHVFLDKEFASLSPKPGKRAGTCLADKLVEVYSRDGRKEFMLIHLEVQGQATSDFAARMFRYYYRIFDRWRRPVTAIAIFTGADGHRIPNCYQFSFAGTESRYKYNVMRINQFSDEELASNPNPFAAVALVAKKALLHGRVTDRTLINRKFALAKHLNGRSDIPKTKLAAILAFLNNYLVFRTRASNYAFEEKVRSIKNKKRAMLLLKMLEVEYKEQVVRRILRRGNHSDRDIAFMVGTPVAMVQKIRKELKAKDARKKARKKV